MGISAPIIATTVAGARGGAAGLGVGGAEEAVLGTAVDDGVAEEGVVAAPGVFDKLEETMTHPVSRLATPASPICAQTHLPIVGGGSRLVFFCFRWGSLALLLLTRRSWVSTRITLTLEYGLCTGLYWIAPDHPPHLVRSQRLVLHQRTRELQHRQKAAPAATQPRTRSSSSFFPSKSLVTRVSPC